MPRFAKLFVMGLVAATVATGSMAWAGSSTTAGQHRDAIRRQHAHERVVRMRCDAMKQRWTTFRRMVLANSTSPRSLRRAEFRILQAQRRAQHRCGMMRQRAAASSARTAAPQRTAAAPPRRTTA